MPDFNEPNLARAVEALTQAQIDKLPFGVVRIDEGGTVRYYSDVEARQSGFNQSAVGLNLYDFCERFGGDGFRGRIDEAREKGRVDLEFGWSGDYADPKRDLHIRVQSASGRGLWIFIERDSR